MTEQARLLPPFNNSVDDDDERLLFDDCVGSATNAQLVAEQPLKLINDNDGIDIDGIRFVGDNGTPVLVEPKFGVGVVDLLPD